MCVQGLERVVRGGQRDQVNYSFIPLFSLSLYTGFLSHTHSHTHTHTHTHTLTGSISMVLVSADLSELFLLHDVLIQLLLFSLSESSWAVMHRNRQFGK